MYLTYFFLDASLFSGIFEMLNVSELKLKDTFLNLGQCLVAGVREPFSSVENKK